MELQVAPRDREVLQVAQLRLPHRLQPPADELRHAERRKDCRRRQRRRNQVHEERPNRKTPRYIQIRKSGQFSSFNQFQVSAKIRF